MLEADRQDAAERFKELQERRKRMEEERQRRLAENQARGAVEQAGKQRTRTKSLQHLASLVADAKAAWWASRDRDAAVRTSWALWGHARRVRPDWPTGEERQADLDHHVRLKAILDRAARAFSRR